MSRKISCLRLLASVAMIGLAGCVGSDLRKGPSPVLDATAVGTASNNKTDVLAWLAHDARIPSSSPGFYYAVAEAGFNYVDDQCRAYFDWLFFLNRGREQAKSGLAAAGQTTDAILLATGAPGVTLGIVAQAFGLASAATDIVAGTYLYALPPATTQGFVERLQQAFRDAAARRADKINSPTTAYYMIQRYLSLCLPPTIEAEITRQISSTSAFSKDVGSGALFSLETASLSPNMILQDRFSRFFQSGSAGEGFGKVSTPVKAKDPPPPPPPPEPPVGSVTIEERSMTSQTLEKLQARLLCVSPTGQFDQSTRDGIRNFQETLVMEPNGNVGPVESKELFKRLPLWKKACGLGARNYFELTLFFPRDEIEKVRVQELQVALNQRGGAQITVNGELNKPTRDKIAAVRESINDAADIVPDKSQVTERLWLRLMSP